MYVYADNNIDTGYRYKGCKHVMHVLSLRVLDRNCEGK